MKNLIKTLSLIFLLSHNGFAKSAIEINPKNNFIENQKIEKFNIENTLKNVIEKNSIENIKFDNENTNFNLENSGQNDLHKVDLNQQMMECSNERIIVEGTTIGYARTCCIGSWCTTREVFFQ
ncbi:hypothetical protein EGI22_10305 [Lacihabitans sp. LS3-19]|uniref:hypothetical protein n=1 Tax=Lacihabitans sp. LS3-19 TaxID=2487335 RepID=UPI0020CE5C15|nr:hypothetical protein [Lacihabitans sp. LS3-19]MCP9768305.1 hypothetical protein [Lacihabitans sp. LS3-19]